MAIVSTEAERSGIHPPMQREYPTVQKPYKGRITVAIEWVTPAMATDLLARNDHNRHLKDAQIGAIEADIRAGKFRLNGETVKVSRAGRLLDGQNRLTALLRSEAEGIWAVVVRGLDDDDQDTVDIGAKRSFSDVLAIHGEEYGTILAAASMLAWKLENNGHPWTSPTYRYPSQVELQEYLADNPGLRNSVSPGDRMRKSAIHYPPSPATALHYLMSKRDADLADWFWETLYSGASLLDGHPILTLRTFFIRELGSSRSGRVAIAHRVAITIKAWNAVRVGKSLRVIKWTRSGDKPEDFPVIA